MAVFPMVKGVPSDGGGNYTYVYIDTTIQKTQEFSFPTVQKAKGISFYTGANESFIATDDMTHPLLGGVEATNYTLSFTDNKIYFGPEYGHSYSYTCKGYYWY